MENMKGLYQKYIIQKSDGTPVDPNADYFVLRLDTDSKARAAIRFYANRIYQENPKLAEDIWRRCLNHWEREYFEKNRFNLENVEITFDTNKKRYGVVNKDLNDYKKGLKVEILAEYEDKTTLGDRVYVVRFIDNRKEMYINNNKIKHVITDDINYESVYYGIEVFSVRQIDSLWNES